MGAASRNILRIPLCFIQIHKYLALKKYKPVDFVDLNRKELKVSLYIQMKYFVVSQPD